MAAKTYLCTTGTSIGKDARAKTREHLSASWVEQRGGAEAAGREIMGWLAEVSPFEEENLKNVLSAEIHSLARLKIDRLDRVVLFASDTADGLACAVANKLYLERYWSGIEVEIEGIRGLQVDDAEAFQKEGVINFVRLCLKKIEQYGESQCVLNPTGGFKALVPYRESP